MDVFGKLAFVCLSIWTTIVSGHRNEILEFACKGDEWVEKNGNCYLSVTVPMSWEDAKETCIRQGANLVEWNNPKDDLEYQYVSTIATTRIWTGYKMTGNEVPDEYKQMTLWGINQPDPSTGMCIAIDPMKMASLEDCDKRHAFVCKYSACLTGFVPCATGGKCINASRDLCDTQLDCDDYSDEMNCSSDCSHYIRIKSDTGSVSTGNLGDFQQCVWTLEADIGKHIKLTIPSTTLVDTALLEVYSGGPTLSMSRLVDTFAGAISSVSVISDNNFLMLRLITGDVPATLSSQNLPYTTEVQQVFNEMQSLTASNSWQSLLYSLRDESYPPLFVELYYSIQAAQDQVISYYVESSNPAYDVDTMIQVFATDAEDGVFHRLKLQNYYTSYSNEIHVKTASDFTSNALTLKYKTGCTLEISEPVAYINSPGYWLGKIPHELTCDWTIVSGQVAGTSLSLTFSELDMAEDPRNQPTHPSVDKLEVYVDDEADPMSNLKVYDSSDKSGRIVAPEGKLKLHLDSDIAIHSTRFSATTGLDCEIGLGAEEHENAIDVLHFHEPNTAECKTGYKFNFERLYESSENTLTCTDIIDKKCVPRCSIVYCGTPTGINNGYIVNTTGVTYGSVARYACYDGFAARDNILTATCGSNGDWTDLPQCTSAQCDALQDNLIANGMISVVAGNPFSTAGEAEFNTVVRFSCNDGYDLVGTEYTQCTGAGWSHGSSIPTCEPIRCPLPMVKNAVLSSAACVNANEVLTVTCNTGYQIEGTNSNSATLTCQSNQTYDKTVECTDINECLNNNGGCQTSSTECENTGGGRVCNCLMGYRPFSATSCLDNDECTVNNGGCNQGCNNNPGNYECSCDIGFSLYIQDGTEGFTIPNQETGFQEGDVYRINHTCVPKKCGNLPSVTNGAYVHWSNSYHHGDVVYGMCDQDYYVTRKAPGQVEEATECDNGEWINVLNCTKNTCGIPQQPFKGSYDKTVVEVGDTLRLTCNLTDTGLQVTRTAVCGQARVFYGEDITSCPEIDCGLPDFLPGWSSIGLTSTVYGQTFTFGCDSGFEQRGSSNHPEDGNIVRCLDNGRWDMGTLQCIGVQCPDPGTPADAVQVSTSFEVGRSFFYRCNRPGFQLASNTTYTCSYQSGTQATWNPAISPFLRCEDSVGPQFIGCSEADIYVDKMSPATFNTPTVLDNAGGTKGIVRSNHRQSGDILLSDDTVVFTVSDFNDQDASCSVQLRTIDRTQRPSLDCPNFKEIAVIGGNMPSENLTGEVNAASGTEVTITPSTVSPTISSIGFTQQVSVTARDVHGTESKCTFLVIYTAGNCFVEQLHQDINAQTTCSDGNSICQRNCNVGYVYPDGSREKNFTCANNEWISPEKKCQKYVNSEYEVEVTVQHTANAPLITSCLEVYSDSLTNSLNNFRVKIQNVCTFDWEVTLSSERILSTFESEGVLKIRLVNSSISNEDRQTCIQRIQENYKTIFAISFSCELSDSTSPSSISTADPALACSLSGYTLTNTAFGQVCVPCGQGMFFNTNTGSCQTCPAGQYSSGSTQTACQQCPDHQQPNNAQTACIDKCQAGFRSNSGLSPCSPCPVDTYWTDSTTCTACPNNGKTDGAEGVSSDSGCYDPCPEGQYSLTGYNVTGRGCQSCPRNFYNPFTARTSCQECAGNRATSSPGATDANACELITDACDRSYCNNNGDCQWAYHRRNCDCDRGYTGNFCQTLNHICDASPCANGATCKPGSIYASYNCICRTDLDICNMQIVRNQQIADVSVPSIGISAATTTQCENACLQNAACVEASHANGFCKLYNVTVTDFESNTDGGIHMTKDCTKGFLGDRCETDNINECNSDSDPCGDNGMCVNKIGSYECLCLDGYSGSSCEIAEQPCSSNPCQHGRCEAQGTVRYTCICDAGFTGINCETNINDCAIHPSACHPNGQCQDRVNSFICDECVDEYRGSYCHIAPEACSTTDCPGNSLCQFISGSNLFCVCDQHFYKKREDPVGVFHECVMNKSACDYLNCDNGMCTDSGGSARCVCDTGFTGSMCQHNIDNCVNNLCVHGTCVDGLEEYSCSCMTGYNGTYCDNNINDCVNNDCTDPGTDNCEDGVDTFTCNCKPGYTGDKCQSTIDYCASCPCRNGGECSNLQTGYQCQCKPGFTGTNCENKRDFCALRTQTCLDGDCYSIENGSFCRCKGGTQGDNCEKLRDVCDVLSDVGLCVNGGQCVNKDGSAECKCPVEYTNSRCSFEKNENQSGTSAYNTAEVTSSTQPMEECKSRCLSDITCDAVVYTENGGRKFCLFYKAGDVMKEEQGNTHFTKKCLSAYSGKSCELYRDWCSDSNNPCKNGGKCEVTCTDYQCVCPDGYSGVNCEIANNPCANNPCGTQATCQPDLTNYICQCQQGRVLSGNSCRVTSQNYVILVNTMGAGMRTCLHAPFRLEGTSLTMMGWIRVHQYESENILFSLVGSDDIKPSESASSFISAAVSLSGVTVKTQTYTAGNMFGDGFGEDLKDGEWHHLALTVDENGVVTVIIDAIKSVKENTLGNGFNIMYNAQVCLGEKVMAEFEGLTVWNEALSHEDVAQAFDQSLTKSTYVQGWWNYQLSSAAVRLMNRLPVTASLIPGPAKTVKTSLNCNGVQNVEYVGDDSVVSISNILGIKTNLDRATGNDQTMHYLNTLPPVLTWGHYPGIVVGLDDKNNYDECRFEVYIKYGQCPTPISNNNEQYETCFGSICNVGCLDPNKMPSADVPNYYGCGILGVADARHPYQRPVLPTCAVYATSVYVVKTYLQFEFSISCVKVEKTDIKDRIKTQFMAINWANLCIGNDCSNLEVMEPVCSTSNNNRVDITFTMEFESSDISISGGGQAKVKDAMKFFVLVDRGIDLSHFANAELVESSAVITSKEGCAAPGNSLLTKDDGTKVCVPCGKGFYFNTSLAVCQPCPLGKYQDEQAQVECKACPTNKTTYEKAADSGSDCKDECKPGEFYSEDNIKCEPCKRHFYQPKAGVNHCVPCSIGSKTVSTGSTSQDDCKVDCPAGMERNKTSRICTNCSRGYWRSLDQDDCQPCSDSDYTTFPGIIAVSQDACSMKKCSTGTFWNVSSANCEACAAGTFQNETLQLSCKPCPGNTSTPQQSAKQESECQFYCTPGYEVVNMSKCQPCKRGTYKSKDMPFEMCGTCPSGNTTDELPATSQSDCKYSMCEQGSVISTTTYSCEPCEKDTYQPVLYPFIKDRCIPCPSHTNYITGTVTGGKNESDCLAICPSGEQFNATSKLCEKCPRKYYKNADEDRFGNCVKCNENYTTDGPGAKSADACNIRDCAPGFKVVNNTDCVACPRGEYQNLPRQSSCIPCGENLNTADIASTSVNDCVVQCGPGKQGTDECNLCPEHYFKPGVSYNLCEPCPTDTSSNAERTECSEVYCSVGKQYSNGQCNICAEGYYKDVKGNDVNCTICPTGYTTNGTGASECNVLHCEVGKYLEGDECVACKTGTYKNTTGNGACTPCPANSTSLVTGASNSNQCDTIVCSAGTFRQPSQKTECTPCPLNQFQPDIGTTSCLNCSQGNITMQTGSVNVDQCVPLCQAGQQYNPSTKTCSPCPVGAYKVSAGNVNNCTSCSTNFTTLSEGSTSANNCSEVVCLPGTYSKINSGRVICEVCLVGSYSDVKRASSCSSCPSGTTTQYNGTDSNLKCIADCQIGSGLVTKTKTCELCPVGFYNDKSGSNPNTCKKCPNGKINYQPGSRICNVNTDTAQQPVPVVIIMKLRFGLAIANCDIEGAIDNIISQILAVVRRILLDLQNAKFRGQRKFCNDGQCRNVVIANPACSAGSSNGRRRRAITHNLEVDVSVSNVSNTVTDTSGTGEEISTEEAISQAIEQNQDSLTIVPNEIEYNSYEIATTTLCLPGQMKDNNDQCINCTAGTYNTDGVTCLFCPVDTYQDLTGQTSCKRCTGLTYTDNTGSSSASVCKALCATNVLYCNNRGTCRDIGTRDAICNCYDDYAGEHCESRAESSSNMPVILGAAIGGGGALILLIVIVVGVYKYLSVKEKKIEKKSAYRSDSSQYGDFINPAYHSGSLQVRPMAPYPAVGYPAGRYRPDASFEEPPLTSAQRLPQDDQATYIWTA